MVSVLVDATADVLKESDALTSLREAVAMANSQPGADTIIFASGADGAFDGGHSGMRRRDRRPEHSHADGQHDQWEQHHRGNG